MRPQGSKGLILPFENRTGRRIPQIGSDLLESKTLVVVIPEYLRFFLREDFVNDRPDTEVIIVLFLLFCDQDVQGILTLWVLFVTEPFQ